MPKLLTNGHPPAHCSGAAGKTPKEQMLAILDRTTTKTWKKDAGRLRQLAAAV